MGDFWCEKCDKNSPFGSERDLRRHQDSKTCREKAAARAAESAHPAEKDKSMLVFWCQKCDHKQPFNSLAALHRHNMTSLCQQAALRLVACPAEMVWTEREHPNDVEQIMREAGAERYPLKSADRKHLAKYAARDVVQEFANLCARQLERAREGE